MQPAYDLTGKRFGRLTALKYTGKNEPSNGSRFWLCRCDCGNLHTVNSNHLSMGNTRSCGCLKRRQPI